MQHYVCTLVRLFIIRHKSRQCKINANRLKAECDEQEKKTRTKEDEGVIMVQIHGDAQKARVKDRPVTPLREHIKDGDERGG